MLLAAASSIVLETPRPPRLTRKAGQVVVGAAIGLYLTPAALQRIAESGVAILLSAVLITIVGVLIGLAQARLSRANLATAIFSCVPGGPMEMANLAAHHGGDPAAAALSQTLRIVAIVLLFPPILLLQDGAGILPQADPPDVVGWGVPVMLSLAVAAGVAASRIGILNPYFLGPMLGTGALTAAGLHLSDFPEAMIAGAQVLLGVSLGSTFRRSLFASGLGFLGAALLTTLALLAACIALAGGLAVLFEERFPVMLLANAPGSVTEMAITAKATGLDVSLVAAFHMVRILFIMALIAPLYRVIAPRSHQPRTD